MRNLPTNKTILLQSYQRIIHSQCYWLWWIWQSHIFNGWDEYWTTACIHCSAYRIFSSWTLYWGLYLNEAPGLFMSQIPENYYSSTDDTLSIYSIFISYNNDEQLISFPSFDISIYNTLVVFVHHRML